VYSQAELLEMITAEGSAQQLLHAQAAAIRDRVFQRSVVIRPYYPKIQPSAQAAR
jgi:hypothetical protein